MKTLQRLRLRVALPAFNLPPDRRSGVAAQKDLGRVIVLAPAFPTPLRRLPRGSVCKILKTDIKLFAAAIVAAATVLGANVTLADIVSTLSGAN
ncbi:hypothetical protein ACFSQT_01125 [Mesorhizobium calcicola]|uniref:Uncharacterized protein n=1 Tax=Mesorhizobium calcicola TaxID=1300310 RepID=A0ABW4W871_9HYPH